MAGLVQAIVYPYKKQWMFEHSGGKWLKISRWHFEIQFLEIKYCISLNFFQGPVDNKTAIIQVMAWFETGDKSLTKLKMTSWVSWHIWGILGQI